MMILCKNWVVTVRQAKQPLIAIEKILDTTQGSEFLDLTYNDKNRFGKVIMKYI